MKTSRIFRAILAILLISSLSAAAPEVKVITADPGEPPAGDDKSAYWSRWSLRSGIGWQTRASSHHKAQGLNSYDVAKIEDGRVDTAWIAGGEGHGIGESITFTFTQEHFKEADLEKIYFNGFFIINGYCEDKQTWKEHSRVKKILITHLDRPLYEVILHDSMNVQAIRFPEEIWLHPGDTVKVTILEVYPGDKYQNAVISELDPMRPKATVGKQDSYRDLGLVLGGQPADGNDLYNIKFGKHDDFERLVLDIHKWVADANAGSKGQGPHAATPGLFWVDYEAYPFRLVFQLEGIRWRSAKFPDFSGSDYISGMYSIHSLDWGNERFVVTLKKPIKFEAFELRNPARVVVDIKGGNKTVKDFPPVYSLRTPSVKYKWEKLFDLEEILTSRTADFTAKKVLKSSDNKYLIEEGCYKTRKEALKRKKILAKEGIILVIEKRNADDIPK